MSIRKIVNKNGEVRYQVTKHIGGHRIRRNFTTHKKAKSFDSGEIAITTPTSGTPIKQVLEDYFDLFSLSKESKDNEEFWLKELYGFLSDDQELEFIEQVRPIHLLKYQKWLIGEPRKRKNTTVNRRFSMVSHLFSFCEQTELIKENPAKKIKNLPDDGAKRYLPPDEDVQEVLGRLSEQSRDFLVIATTIGNRPIEVRQMTFRDVDFHQGQVILRSKKGGKHTERVVPMVGEMREIFMRRYHQASPFNRPQDPVFSKGGGVFYEKRFGYQNMKRMIIKVNREREAQGAPLMKPFCQYALRHKFCSDLSKAGYSDAVVGLLMGHANSQTTKKYTHVDTRGHAEILEGLDRKVLQFKRALDA